MTFGKRLFLFLVTIGCLLVLIRCQFLECHDEASFTPSESTLEDRPFSWLGVLQYIHVKNGTPHYFRVPRVVLITRHFVLSTAVDAAEVPIGYALGNVVFGDYERDADECELTTEELAAGAECPTAVMLMPIADVLLHPEYKHFGAKNSLAIMKLLKPVKSVYVLPACLPFKDFIIRKDRRQTVAKFYHIDYENDVPRDFIEENKEVQRLSLLPRELCFLYDENTQNSSHFLKDRMACTTGCGLHSGAPSLVHEKTGHWSIVAISLGGSICPDVLRPRRPPPPPQHVLIHPYVPWITAAISGKAVGAFAKDDPFGFVMPRASDNPHDVLWHTWIGHWFMGGPRCYDRGDAADDMFHFYHEIFQIVPEREHTGETYMTYYVEIDAMEDMVIVCAKVGLPFRMARPMVLDVNSPEVKVFVKGMHFYQTYKFQISAFGYNTSSTEVDLTSSITSYQSCSQSYCSE